MSSLGITVATYGDVLWVESANEAMLSAVRQTVPATMVVHVHGRTLAEARNAGARACGTEWLVFLDGDDALDRLYLEAMLSGTGDVRQPSTLGVYPDGREDDEPVLIPPRPLIESNYLCVGCMVRAELFHRVGGFRELPVLEDWDLWLRCRLDGAIIGSCPGAIYRVAVREGSRNQDQRLHAEVYRQIRSEYMQRWTELASS